MGGAADIAVLGAGAWGTSLARLAALNGHRVRLWTRDADIAADIAAHRQNRRRLAGIRLPDGISATADLAALTGVNACILAVPAQALAATLANLRGRSAPDVPMIVAAKGIDAATGRRMSEIVAAALPAAPVLVLSGPSFAEDVARDLPTAVTLAGRDDATGKRVRELLARPTFRIYLTDDVPGTEIGGAVKNVLAIAAGVVEGRALGASARAALIARGFAELGRYAEALGGRRETVAGLSGLGDLVLTCSSVTSRNYSFGIALGQGVSPAQAMQRARGVVEGATTAPVLARDASARGVDMPISTAAAQVIGGETTVDAAIDRLLARPMKREDG